MASVLLYNLSGSEKFSRLKTALMMSGVSFREVSPSEYHLPIASLLPGTQSSNSGAEKSFTDEMMVLCGLNSAQFNRLLDTMKRNRCTVALKAVLTETNSKWTSVRLHQELLAEHRTIQASQHPSAHKK